MQSFELVDLTKQIAHEKTEGQTIEIKAAKDGCPKKLYDTISGFSNQDEGGIIVFGINEKNGFAIEGVYDAHHLQQCIVDQCKQMTPVVRPVLTSCVIDDITIVSAEIPSIDISERPCFYTGIGRAKGSYVRTGAADERMTDYEIYSYEAFRKRYNDEIRPVERASFDDLDETKINLYLLQLKSEKPNLAQLSDEKILELMSLTKNGTPTLLAVLLFSPYPQAYFPQLCIIATVIPGDTTGTLGEHGERFIDNRRIEGPLPDMLQQSIRFASNNMNTRTVIDPQTGVRQDITDYPIEAIREALLNALVHRDYSIHTQGMPIQLQLFQNRLELTNPGGLYGRLRIDQLGTVQPDTRNPSLATTMEVMKLTENRYSGIPSIKRSLRDAGLPSADFRSSQGEFQVTFKNTLYTESDSSLTTISTENSAGKSIKRTDSDLLAFCKTPRTRKEIADYLGLRAVSYALKTRIEPLIVQGSITLSIPEKPQSPQQRYFAQ